MIRKKHTGFVLVLLSLGLIVVSLLALSLGYESYGLADIFASLARSERSMTATILFQFRLPRILACVLGGASLALSGLLLQTLTHNPLADSGILGINAGAGLVMTLLLTSPMTLYLNRLLPLGAMLGGGLTIFLVYLLSYRKYQGISPARLIVTGVGVSTMLSGIMISLMTSQEQGKLDAVVNWLSGRVTGDDWTWLMMLAPLLVLVWLLTFSRGRALNIMNLNDQTAMALGLELQKERLRALVLSTILAALSVLLVGNITFVGLLARHTARKLVGGDHRFLIPASLLLGAILLLVADTIGRLLLVGTGIPTGLIVSIIGAPFFLYLLIKHQ